MSAMEKGPNAPQDPRSSANDGPPPFEPDPDIVTFLEPSRRRDPKEIWKATAPERT
jgi:hypothetical protein